jgi:hypothetical protein
VESAGFPCLLLSASALLANVADGPRTEPQVQANSTILACCVGKGQTRGSSWSTKAIDSRKLSLKSNRLSGKGQLQTPLSAALRPTAYGEGNSILHCNKPGHALLTRSHIRPPGEYADNDYPRQYDSPDSAENALQKNHVRAALRPMIPPTAPNSKLSIRLCAILLPVRQSSRLEAQTP